MRNPVRVPGGFAEARRGEDAGVREEAGFFHHGGTEAVEGGGASGDPHGGFTEARLSLSFLSSFSAVYG